MDQSTWFIVIVAVLLYATVLIDQKRKSKNGSENIEPRTETKTLEIPAIYQKEDN